MTFMVVVLPKKQTENSAPRHNPNYPIIKPTVINILKTNTLRAVLPKMAIKALPSPIVIIAFQVRICNKMYINGKSATNTNLSVQKYWQSNKAIIPLDR